MPSSWLPKVSIRLRAQAARVCKTYALGATNNQTESNANQTYFSLFEVPVSGTYDQFSLFQGDEPNDGNYPDLEIAIYEKVDETWQLVGDSNVFTLDDMTGVDYRLYNRSGLNAALVAHTPYLFVLRITGTSWRFSNHTANASVAPFTTWTKSVTQSLSSYTTTLSDTEGTRVAPWFRLSQ